jgi:hypothetical protein
VIRIKLQVYPMPNHGTDVAETESSASIHIARSFYQTITGAHRVSSGDPGFCSNTNPGSVVPAGVCTRNTLAFG